MIRSFPNTIHRRVNIQSKQWRKLSKHSPLSQTNREAVDSAVKRGQDEVNIRANIQEISWLREQGYPVTENGNLITVSL